MDKLVKTAADKPDDLPKAGVDFAKANKIDNDSIKDVMDYLGKRDEKGPQGGRLGPRQGARRDQAGRHRAEAARDGQGQADEREADGQGEGRPHRAGQPHRRPRLHRPRLSAHEEGPGQGPQGLEGVVRGHDQVLGEFEKAIGTNDPKKVKEAAAKLNSSCVNVMVPSATEREVAAASPERATVPVPTR